MKIVEYNAATIGAERNGLTCSVDAAKARLRVSAVEKVFRMLLEVTS